MSMILLTQNKQTALNFDHVYDLSVYDSTVYATVGYDVDRKPIEIVAGEYSSPEAAQDALRKVIETLSYQVELVEMPE